MMNMEYNEQNNRRPKIGAKKYRRNFIDLLLLLLIVASVLSFFFRGRLEALMTEAMASDRVSIGFVITDADPRVANTLEVGTTLYLDSKVFGEVGYIDVSDADTVIFKSTVNPDTTRIDEFVRVGDSTKKKISGTLSAVGARKDSGFYLAGKEKIAVGMTLTLSDKGQNYTILVTRVD